MIKNSTCIYAFILVCLLSFCFGNAYQNKQNEKDLIYIKEKTENFFSSIPKNIIEESIDRLHGVFPNKVSEIEGLIVNHHLLASHLISKTFLSIQKEPETIILIAPNHFWAGFAKVQTSIYSWNTPYGVLDPNNEKIKILLQNDSIQIENDSFKKEHGIFNIVPFIKKFFPNTQIVPLIVKDTLTEREAKKIAVTLKNIMTDNTLVIGSFDFSHDSIPTVAFNRDKESLSVIMDNKLEGVYSDVSVDSKPGLFILLDLMNARGKKFNLIENTNSSILIQDKDQKDTTSYIVGYFK